MCGACIYDAVLFGDQRTDGRTDGRTDERGDSRSRIRSLTLMYVCMYDAYILDPDTRGHDAYMYDA